jgi:hypothetical protein
VPSAGEEAVRGADAGRLVDGALDRAFLVGTLADLARVPTNVELGFDTLIEPDDPKLVHYVQDVVRRRLLDIGVYDLIDARRNNLVARLGSGESGRCLLIQSYTTSQHHNLMERPFDGVVANGARWGRDEPVVISQGVSQNKSHQAVMLTVLKLLGELRMPLRGRLYWRSTTRGAARTSARRRSSPRSARCPTSRSCRRRRTWRSRSATAGASTSTSSCGAPPRTRARPTRG